MQNKLDRKIRRWITSLKEKYHLSLINKDSFEQLYSWQVSKGMFLLALISIVLLTFTLSMVIISFTPIKKFVPGFESDEMHQQLVQMTVQLEQMERELDGKLKYAAHLDTVLSGIEGINLIEEAPVETTSTSIKNVPSNSAKLFNYHFFKPVSGLISQKFNVPNRHYGIDIVCKKNETVKAILGGKIILSAWTVEEGNVLAIQHQDNLISFYKHNSVLLKRRGELVKAGDIIAVVGNSGELTNGPHLHFEIWQNGSPLNPADLINFE